MITFRFIENDLKTECKFGPLLEDNDYDYPVNALQSCLEEISKPQLRSNFELEFSNVVITRPVVLLLIQLLNGPFSDFMEPTPPGKWDFVKFSECWLPMLPKLLLPVSLRALDDDLYCDAVDFHAFGRTVSRRTLHLSLIVNVCPDILYALVSVPEPHYEFGAFSIVKQECDDLDCGLLVHILSRNQTPLQAFALTSLRIADPLGLAEGLEFVVNLFMNTYDDSFRITGGWSAPRYGSMFVGEDGNGLLPTLLRNPSSRLKSLRLKRAHLEDRHFIALVETLHTSQLESLKIDDGYFSWRGMMAFANQLPSITCLKKVEIDTRWDNGVPDEVLMEVYAALVVGMKCNYSIETICLSSENHDDPVHKCLTYYADLNRVGRQTLNATNSVPGGLWPLILERAGMNCLPTNSRRADAIYFLLQHSPVISSIHR